MTVEAWQGQGLNAEPLELKPSALATELTHYYMSIIPG